MLPELDYTDENRAKLKVIHDKITFMLMDKNYLSTIYRRKSYILTTIIFICILISILWFSLIHFLQSDFSCKLEAGDALKESPLVACNISPQIYIYGIMLLHVLILLLMFAFSIKSIIWHVRMTFRVRNRSDKLFGELADDYKGLPGYEDLAIILELFSGNVCDGHFVINVIMYVLTSRYDHRRPIFVKNNTAIAIKNKKNIIHSFWEEYCIVNCIVSEIGLMITNYEQTQDTLFNHLNKLCENHSFTCFSVGFNARAEIYREISRNISYYSYLAESEKSFPPLLPGSTCNLDSKMIYSHPFDSDSIQSTVILVYITPYYYYSVENQKNITAALESNKLDYLRHSRYRERLRQNAMRKVGALSTNNIFKRAKAVIDHNVQLTDTSYFTSHHIPPKVNTSEPKITIDDIDEIPIQTNSFIPSNLKIKYSIGNSLQNIHHSLHNVDNKK
ncbi:hypothetical protein MXB_3085 [Myxobolus squamalis]|nr:hypothetical protein MXB_3085 [Myxobolus squamalis]